MHVIIWLDDKVIILMMIFIIPENLTHSVSPNIQTQHQ
jgi:hypothetical protein